jgi:hypothetical protein
MIGHDGVQYVSACGEPFAARSIGMRHERECPVCKHLLLLDAEYPYEASHPDLPFPQTMVYDAPCEASKK